MDPDRLIEELRNIPKADHAEVLRRVVGRLPADQQMRYLEVVRPKLERLHTEMAQGTIGPTPWYDRPAWDVKGMAVGGVGPTVRGAINAIPDVLAGAAGVVAPAIAGASIANPPMTLPVVGAATGAAGVAGAIGEGVRQVGLEAIGARPGGTPNLDMAAIIKEGAAQAGLEVFGQGLFHGARGLFAPGRGQMDRPVAAAVGRLRTLPGGAGLEAPASALTHSKPVHLMEAYASEGLGGAGVQERIRNFAFQLSEIADSIVQGASRAQGPMERGAVIADGLKAYKDGWIKTKRALFDDYEAQLSTGPWMQLPETAALLEDRIKMERAAGRILGRGGEESSQYGRMLDGLTEVISTGPRGGAVQRELRNVRLRDVEAVTRKLEFEQSKHPYASGEAGFIRKLQATVNREMEAAMEAKNPAAYAAYKVANETYLQGIRRINSAFGTLIHDYAQKEQYDLIGAALSNMRMSANDIPKLLEVVGPEGTDAVRASALALVLDKARSATTEAGAGAFTATGIERAARNFGGADRQGWERLRVLLTPEQYSKLRDLSTASQSLAGVQKAVFGSPSAGKLRIAGYTAALGAGAASGVLGNWNAAASALAYLVGDPSFNRFIASRAGQTWLTTGFPRAGAAAGWLGRQTPRVVRPMFAPRED